MLTPDQAAVIKQTVPVLQAHGETLTRHFYARMFRHNPEVQDYFNPAHQRSGRQQRALAGAILAYAQHIDEPSALGDAVELIAQKHVSLTIRPAHYPIVGEHLLASIREVLGEAASQDVIDAWAAAYSALADIFIARERAIYAEQSRDYGWNGFKDFIVANREAASDNIVSFELAPADGRPLPAHRPGQYVAIRVTLADGHTVLRHYSLSNAPGTPCYRISVKREAGAANDAPAGVVSSHLHDGLSPGARVGVTPPCGEFTLELPDDPGKPVVFIAGGVGITPLLSMLHAALAHSSARRPIVLVQGAVDGSTHAFGDEIRALAARHPNLHTHVRYSAPTPDDRQQAACDSEGFIDQALLSDLVGAGEAEWYFCGPTPMLRHIRQLLAGRGVAERDMHYEFFGPAGAL